ncbi:hypothetical protein ACFXKG_22815 [Streptomyces sp. NPDC059255]|uniref:hypothetical protein n=1 Tax=Streptomyces sp. NPDC059255 TaxID=3346793 RepID=UPI00369E6660
MKNIARGGTAVFGTLRQDSGKAHDEGSLIPLGSVESAQAARQASYVMWVMPGASPIRFGPVAKHRRFPNNSSICEVI